MTNLTLKTIKKINYDRPDVEKGYANQTLCVDIYTTDIFIKPVTEKMKEVFSITMASTRHRNLGRDFENWEFRRTLRWFSKFSYSASFGVGYA